MSRPVIHNSNSFTLIELLVTIAVIGLLASIVLVAFNLPERRRQATLAKSLQFSQSIQNALGAEAVGWWSFEKVEAGKTPDSSANGNEGTVCVDVTQVEGVKLSSGVGTGLALKFDSIKDRVFVPYSNPFEYRGEDLTIEFWANPASSELDGGYMVSKPWNGSGHYNYWVRFEANRTVSVRLEGQTTWSVATSKKISPENWHHIAVSFTGAVKNVKIYLDAELVIDTSHTINDWTPPGPGDANRPLTIGDIYPYGCGSATFLGKSLYTFDGLLDEVRIYRQALTAGQIQKHYVEGLARHRELTNR